MLHSGSDFVPDSKCAREPSNAYYVTRAELALTAPTSQLRQEPPSPGSGGFSALTPSQSESTFLSDHSASLFGVQFSLNEINSTLRGSKEDGTPENAIDDVAGVGGATGENPTLLRGINGSSEWKCQFPLSEVPC